MLGFLLNNKIYHWGLRIDKQSLLLKKVRDSVNKVINIAIMVLAVLLFVFFVYQAFFVSQVDLIIKLDFWLEPSLTLFVFWLAVLVSMFIAYRLLEADRLKGQVSQLEFDGQLPEITELSEAEAKSKIKVDISRAFNLHATTSVEEAYVLAERFNQAVEPIHLFIGTLSSTQVSILFARLGLSFTQVKEQLNRRLNGIEKTDSGWASQGMETLLASYLNSLAHHRQNVSAIEIFIEAYNRDEFIKELFYDLEITEEIISNVVAWIRINEEMVRRYYEYSKAASRKPKGAMNRTMTSLATPMLDRVAEDLTRAAAYGNLPMLVGRQSELESIFRIIEGGNQSVVLVGPTGVGKKALVYGLAQLMVEEQVPKTLQDKRLVKLSIPHLTSGASATVVQERLLILLDEIAQAGNIIVMIDNIDQLPEELSSALIDGLSRGATFVIATATPEAYASQIERSALAQMFQKVMVPEPEVNEAILILEAKVNGIEYKNNVIFSYDALDRAVSLSDRYMHEKFLPSKAIEICQETALDVFKRKGKGAFVSGEDVAKIIAEKTKIPVTQVAEEEKAKLLHLEEVMHERMIGQDLAVEAVASALRRARAELRSGKRPIANFLFLGPTGVGKTELAKTTAEAYFGSDGSMIRFDMSEFQNQNSLEKLIGAAGQVGQLTEAVRNNPFSLLLLDELEKAHPDILNLFLQVMDDGRLSDGAGRTIDFTNVILIATSNAGTGYIQDQVAAETPLDQIKTYLIETELKQIYRPEFLNRFDDIIVFKPLTMEEVVQIAYLMISQVAERLEAKGISFQAEDAAVHELAEQGFDPKFGARPLRRVIQDRVENALAESMLANKVGRRDTLLLKSGGQIEVVKATEL